MIDSIFNSGTYAASKQLLDASVLRHEALASNLANIETPGYKRVDLAPDFAKEFAARVRDGGAAIVQDKNAPAQRKDGNNVVLDHELLAMNRNAAEYDALTEFVSGSLKQLRLAVTGRSA
jgi:flagellar basal-body rod protein FlgB